MGAQVDGQRVRAPRYGRSFLPTLIVGSAVMTYGVYGLFENAGRTHPGQWVRWFIGAALVHDLLLAPVIVGLGVLTMRTVPERWYASVQTALITTALVCASVAPFLLGFGRRADNPTLLPNDYWRGLAYVLSVVWAGILIAHAAVRERDDLRETGGCRRSDID